MKHYFCFLLLSLSISIGAQTTKRITFEFNEADFELQKEGSKSLIISAKHAIVYDETLHSPALPYLCVNYLIGKNENYIGNQFIAQSILFGSDVEIASNLKCIPLSSHEDANRVTENVSDELEQYPQEKVIYTGTHFLGEYKFLSFLICPFSYKAKEKCLYLDTKIDIDIELSVAMDERDSRMNTPKKSALNQITKMVINSDDIDKLYQTESLRDSASDSLYHYLIVTVDSLKDEYQRLADWKTTKGCRAQVVTMDSINSTYATDTCFVRIKKMIQNYYSRSYWDLQYVLLGGSTDLIPTLKCYSENIFPKHVEYPDDGACDTYYACLTDIDWDKNHNSLYGDSVDSVDLTQYFSVSRLSTRNVSEANNIVNRLIEYEQYPDTLGWKNQILMCGIITDTCFTENNQLISDSQWKCEKLYSDYISPSGWSGSRFRFYDTDTDHPNGALYDVTADNLQKEFSKGYAFAHIDTHGNTPSYTMEDGFYYHTFHVDTLHAPRYTLVMTEACRTNNIEWPSFFLGGAFMKSSNAGFIGYYGCSENSISYGGQTLGPVEHFCGAAWNKLFTGTRQLGDAVREAKNIYLSSAHNGYNSNRWQYLYMNLLSDPELNIYTEKPQTINNFQIAHSYNILSLLFGYNNTKVAVMSRFDKGNTFYDVWDSYGLKNYLLDTNEYMVTITRANCIPYRTIFGNTVYLQNESLANDLNVEAEQAIIGSNVVSDRSQGPVVVENGSSTIATRSGTKIYNDFEVKQGASLIICTNNNELFQE